MKLYLENVEDYLAEYGTLTKTIIFTIEGEKLFSEPSEVEFVLPHLRAVLSCMADSLHPLAGVVVGDVVYKCLRVDDCLLVGRSDAEEFVAYRTENVVVVGFNDREKSGDCCLTDVKNVAAELFRPSDVDVEEDEILEREEQMVTKATILQTTTASPHLAKPRVSFTDRSSPVPQRASKTKLLRPPLPENQYNDFEVVNGAFESHRDEENSLDEIKLDKAPKVTPEEIQLKEL